VIFARIRTQADARARACALGKLLRGERRLRRAVLVVAGSALPVFRSSSAPSCPEERSRVRDANRALFRGAQSDRTDVFRTVPVLIAANERIVDAEHQRVDAQRVARASQRCARRRNTTLEVGEGDDELERDPAYRQYPDTSEWRACYRDGQRERVAAAIGRVRIERQRAARRTGPAHGKEVVRAGRYGWNGKHLERLARSGNRTVRVTTT